MNFYRDWILIVVGCGTITWMVATAWLASSVPVTTWIGLALIATLTLAVYRVLSRLRHKRAQLFVAYYMGSLTAKLLLSAAFLVGVGLFQAADLAFTAITYFVAYVLLTVAELRNLLELLRKSDGGSSPKSQ